MSVEQFELKIATVAGKYPDEAGSDTLTFDELTHTANKVDDYSLVRSENYALQLSVRLWNKNGGLVGSTYNATNGTGSLASGQQVNFSLYPSLTGVKTIEFHGEIVALTEKSDGLLEITCLSPLAKLDRFPIDKYWVAGTYREDYERTLVWFAWTPSWPSRIDTLDTTWVEPPIMVKICTLNDWKYTGTTRTGDRLIDNGNKIYAQTFEGKSGDHVRELTISAMGDAANTATLRVGIMECAASGVPNGTWICYFDDTGLPNDGGYYIRHINPDNATGDGFTYADRLRPDKTYAIAVKAVGDLTTVHLHIGMDDGTTNPHAYYYDGASWSQLTVNFAQFELLHAPWQDIEVGNAYRNAAYTDEMWIDGTGRLDTPDYNATWYEQACLTYFYGTIGKTAVMENLINLVFGTAYDDVTGGLTETFGIYRTMGKSPLECLRQIADLEDAAYTRQLVVYDLWAAPDNYIFVRPKYNTSDASAITFSDSGTTDAALRIVEHDLTKADALKINTVELRGEGGNKRPIFASSVDWTNRALFGANTHRVTDKNFTSYPDCLREAKRIRLAINRADWEGTITVGGCYPDLLDLTTGIDDAVKGGKIITLNIASLNISATKFKVRSVTCTPGKTVIAVTNYDYSQQDEMDAKRLRSRLAENFVGGDDIVKEYYLPLRLASGIGTASLYMELQTAAGAAIAGQTRVLCTKSSDTAVNIYHATFEQGNGYTASTVPVGKVVLFDAATGGSVIGTVTLAACEYFYKLKITRVSVDVFTNP